jgi:hypothetical protein
LESGGSFRKRVAAIPRVNMDADEGGTPAFFDRLIVQVYPRLMERPQAAQPLADRSSRITLITAGDRNRPWRRALALQWREFRALARWLGKIDRIAYKDGCHSVDLFAAIKPRTVTGFDIHSQFLQEEESFVAIHARDWKPEARRPVRANFLGSRDPAIRSRVVDSVRPFFQRACMAESTVGALSGAKTVWPDSFAAKAAPTEGRKEKVMFWLEYSDSSPAGLASRTFLDVLVRSDFTLCPPGYSLVTHRPMEALLRGSIPVLDEGELDLYDLDLEDGINCITVRGANWPETMKRLAMIKEDALIDMRRHIHAMFDSCLSYEISARRMRGRLGISDDVRERSGLAANTPGYMNG